MIPLAHAGPWAESIIYLVPIIGFGLWLGITTLKDRRARKNGEGGDPDAN